MTRHGRPRRVAAVVASVLLVAGGAGCGDDGSASAPGSVEWVAPPRVFAPQELPDDRVLSGELENTSADEVRLDAERARLVDRTGETVPGTVRFTGSVGHGLYSPRRSPEEDDPEFERRRLGELAVLAPGQTTPVTLSWRVGGDRPRPVRLEVGGQELALPGTPTPAR